MLGYYSVWPYFIEIGVVLAIAATPLFRSADSPPVPTTSRIETLDGLRGFLALSVFFHHSAIYHQFLATGMWGSPPSRFYWIIGPDAVSMFFMITGYLFYSQILKARGRPDWKKLYIGRVFRLLPLYWFDFALVLVAVGMHTGWHLCVSPLSLIGQIVRGSAGGLFPESSINGSNFTHRITFSVIWSLQYEWFYYLSLPALAILARWRRSGLLLPPALLCFAFLHEMFVKSNTPVIFVGLFLIGMSTAAIRNSKPSPNPGPFGSQMVILYLVLAFIASPIPFRPIPALLLGIAFLFIACGTDVFGFLTTRPARRLGNISYGIYLLQGAVFTGASLFGSLRALDLGSPIGHWTVSLLEAIVLLALATLTHRFVERPAIDLGRRLVSK